MPIIQHWTNDHEDQQPALYIDLDDAMRLYLPGHDEIGRRNSLEHWKGRYGTPNLDAYIVLNYRHSSYHYAFLRFGNWDYEYYTLAASEGAERQRLFQWVLNKNRHPLLEAA